MRWGEIADTLRNCAIAERLRESIEAAQVPLLGSASVLKVSVSFGVAATTEGDKNSLIASADVALCAAKHEGKNRTVHVGGDPADALGDPVPVTADPGSAAWAPRP